MIRLKYLYSLLIILFLGFNEGNVQAQSPKEKIDFNELSEQFLHRIKNNESTQEIQDILSSTTIDVLEKTLDTNDKKLAFWVNIYNAYIQVILQKNPDL